MRWSVIASALLVGLAAIGATMEEKVLDEVEQYKPPVESRIDQTAPGVRQFLTVSPGTEEASASEADSKLHATWRAPRSE